MIEKIFICFFFFSITRCEEILPSENDLCESNDTCTTYEDILNVTEIIPYTTTEPMNRTKDKNITTGDDVDSNNSCFCDLEVSFYHMYRVFLSSL